MANLGLSEDERLVQDMMAKFAREELTPVATKADEHESAPEALLRKAHTELGLALMAIPEKFGGAWDGTPQDVQRIVRTQELSAGCAGIALALPGLGEAGAFLTGGFVPEDQAKKILEPFCGEDPAWAALALTEPDAAADLALLETKAEKSGDSWKITGVKGPILNAARARGFVVVARDGSGPRLFWVEKDAEGVEAREGKYTGLRAAGIGKVTFKGANAQLLGADDPAAQARAAAQLLAHARLVAAAAMSGVCHAALNTSIEYSKSRVQFGEPIGQKQGIAFMEADMAMAAESIDMLVWNAASLLEQGKPFEAAANQAYGHAARWSLFVTENAVQLHGGYGFIREYPVEKHMRDTKTLAVLFGCKEDAFTEYGATLK